MRKLLLCITMILIAFMFVSCKTATKSAPETSKPEKPLAASAFNLNGKWKVTVDWKAGGNSGTSNMSYKIVQNGMEIIMITQSGDKIPCTLKGNVIRLEPRTTNNPNSLVTNYFPDRQYEISQDGNTLTSEFDYTWSVEGDDRDRLNPGSMTVTMTRE